tara:strand:+ start:4407 stop:4625 length:219 start_codon:yes stop_codon:yes gene_type:complete
MKHWKTKENMGNGFQFNEKDHMENGYNSLVWDEVPQYEKNVMRTFYLIRDVWDRERKLKLKKFLDNNLDEEL